MQACDTARNRQSVGMKIRTPLLVCLFVSGLLGPALALTANAADSAAQEEEGTIPGIAIPRASGGFLGLEIVGGNFKISFYDTKKKPVPVDVTRATARWDNKQKLGSDFTVLNPASDNMSLVGAKFVRPPYKFIVFLTLLNEAGEGVESYPVNMMQ